MKITPFNGLSIATKKEDSQLIDQLLTDNPEEQLCCENCGSHRFIIKALVVTDMEVVVATNGEKMAVVVDELDPKEAIGLNIVRCAICKGNSFIGVVDEMTMEAACGG